MSQHSLNWATAGMVPARKSVREDPKFAEMGAVTQFAKELDYVNFVPAVPGFRTSTRSGTPRLARHAG
jgi:multiple sugar transport system substrate-binding protein